MIRACRYCASPKIANNLGQPAQIAAIQAAQNQGQPGSLQRFQTEARAEALSTELEKQNWGGQDVTGGADSARDIVAPTVADDVAKGYTGGAEDSVTYRRVQGGTGNNTSRQRININPDDSITISKKNWNLSVSIDNGEHSSYFRNSVRGDANTYTLEFDVPKWFDDFLQGNAIAQKNYRTNPLNLGKTAPKKVDPTMPGKAYELPPPWVEWLEEYATNAKIK